MRTFHEIAERVNKAIAINDVGAIRRLAREMQALGTPQAVAGALRSLGRADAVTGDYPSALEQYRQALAMYEELGSRHGVAGIAGNMGLVYAETGDYPLALEHYKRALAVFEELGDRAGVASMTSNIGGLYTDTGNYPSALEHHRRALALYEELGDRASVAGVTGNMGIVYLYTGDISSALEHFRRALAVREDLGDRANAADIIGNIGNLYIDTGDYVLALEHFRRALAISEEAGDRPGVAHLTGSMIHALLGLDRFDEAAELLELQTAMNMEAPMVRGGHAAHRAHLAEHREDLEAAREYLQQALVIVTEAGLRAKAGFYHAGLRDLAQKRNDFAGYIEHNNEYQRISEEVSGKETTQKIAIMESERKMETERRERDKERALLYGALPESVANRMIRGEDVSGDHFDNVSVLFLDIVGFSAISDRIPAGHVVHLLKAIFKICDDVCKQHGITKIKTIGDSYLAVAGVPEPLTDHAQRAAAAALDLIKGLDTLQLTMDPKIGDTSWTQSVGEISVRIGLHCGPLVAGIVGEERLQYDVWGDTVNVASRMESTGEPGKVQVSEQFADSLAPGTWHLAPGTWHLALRGETSIKGKGTMKTFWLEGA